MNAELALQGIEDARRSPENFDMKIWGDTGDGYLIKNDPDFKPACGTKFCYAGFISLRVAPVGTVIQQGYLTLPDSGCRCHVETYATEALGITTDQASSVFYLDDIDQVEAAVRYLADNPDASGETLWEMFGPPDAEFTDDL